MTMDWGDADTLITLLETFKETTENKISGIETYINTDITKDWKENSMRIEQDQHTRNRNIIQEIVENTKLF